MKLSRGKEAHSSHLHSSGVSKAGAGLGGTADSQPHWEPLPSAVLTSGVSVRGNCISGCLFKTTNHST